MKPTATTNSPGRDPGLAERIPNQVKLPLGIALGVVLQGLRIRLGRSLVTITGVTCGIAFLMSILTGQLVKKGVASEDETRTEVGRVTSFMRGELPKLQGKTVGIVGSGAMSEVETRVAASLARDFGAAGVVLDSAAAPTPRHQIPGATRGSAQDADLVLLMGGSAAPAFDFKAFAAKSLNTVVASTILESDAEKVGVPSGQFVKLARTLTEEELAKLAADRQKEKFRNAWIAIISLLVTVIGITNAMLMSVTERFREIGTMKCLGALSSFVTRMFVMEATIMGVVGGIAGALFGALFATAVYTITYGAGLVFSSLPVASVSLYGLLSILAGVVLSIVAALYPARVAAAMVPATALRSTV